MKNTEEIRILNLWIIKHAHRLNAEELAEYEKLWNAAYRNNKDIENPMSRNEQLLDALQAALEALKYSEPIMKHYSESVERHKQAILKVKAAMERINR